MNNTQKKTLSEMTLEELWKLFPIILRPYNPDWPLWYAEEAEKLRRLLEDKIACLRHIGSTSVPGLTAKPTVDILLEISPETDLPWLRRTLGDGGWTAMAESSAGEWRYDLNKGYTPEGFAERVFHLHIRYPGDYDEPYFCAYLRRHADVAAEYVALKKSLAARFEHDRDAYTAAKTDFIREHTARAREEIKTFSEDVIELRKPAPAYAAQVMAYKEEALANGDLRRDGTCLHGCAGLEDCATYEEWSDFAGRLRRKYGAAYVPSDVYLAIRRADDRLVGMLDFRHPLSAAMLVCAGHIGYSVRPAERGKGYGREMLRLALPLCRAAGEKRVLLCCARENSASERVIQACGGTLENEVPDTIGLSRCGIVRRYWIDL